MKGFTDLKITLIHDVLLYYQFLYNDSKEALADDPTQWVQGDFKKWRSQERHPSTTAHISSHASNTTTTSTASVIISTTEKAEDAWLSWQPGMQDSTVYPILENDRNYTDWIINIKRQFKSKRCKRVINPWTC